MMDWKPMIQAAEVHVSSSLYNDTALSLAHFPLGMSAFPHWPVKCEKRALKKHISCYFSERLFLWKLGWTALHESRTASERTGFRSLCYNRPTWNWCLLRAQQIHISPHVFVY